MAAKLAFVWALASTVVPWSHVLQLESVKGMSGWIGITLGEKWSACIRDGLVS